MPCAYCNENYSNRANILRFIVEAPYRQIKYDTMQVEKIISNEKEAEARRKLDETLKKMNNLQL